MIRGIESAGVVVSNDFLSLIVPSAYPVAQTIFDPPISSPPYSLGIRVTIIDSLPNIEKSPYPPDTMNDSPALIFLPSIPPSPSSTEIIMNVSLFSKSRTPEISYLSTS